MYKEFDASSDTETLPEIPSTEHITSASGYRPSVVEGASIAISSSDDDVIFVDKTDADPDTQNIKQVNLPLYFIFLQTAEKLVYHKSASLLYFS